MHCSDGNKTPGNLGSLGCPHQTGEEGCQHPSNEPGICAHGLCPVNVEITQAGCRALAGRKAQTELTPDAELVWALDYALALIRRWHGEPSWTVYYRSAPELLDIKAALAKHAPHVRRCRVCGCTEEFGCPGGCWWVGDDLCSDCQE